MAPQETAIVFENCGGDEVALYWQPPGEDAAEVRYATVKPGEAYWQHTYVGHRWAVRRNAWARDLLLRCVGAEEVRRVLVPDSKAVVGPRPCRAGDTSADSCFAADAGVGAGGGTHQGRNDRIEVTSIAFRNDTSVPLAVFAVRATYGGDESPRLALKSDEARAQLGVGDGIASRTGDGPSPPTLLARLEVGGEHIEEAVPPGRRFEVRTAEGGAHVGTAVASRRAQCYRLAYSLENLCPGRLHPSTNARVYREVRVAGFRVMLAEGLPHRGAFKAALRHDLGAIRAALPRSALAALRDVRLYMNASYHYNGKRARLMCTHWSAEWLARHRNLPEKAGHLECYSVDDYLACRATQPSMLLHELAHCYHYRRADAIDARIQSAYAAAMSAGRYDAVAHINGGPAVPHYARTNHMEYFAECSEAFFSTHHLRNDFYPFRHHELYEFDPDGFAMVSEAWGVPPAHMRRLSRIYRRNAPARNGLSGIGVAAPHQWPRRGVAMLWAAPSRLLHAAARLSVYLLNRCPMGKHACL